MVTLKDCTSCGLHKGCNSVGITPTHVPEEVDFLVVMDNPSYLDDKNGTILENEKDELIFKILQDVIGANMNKIHFTYAVKCCKNTSTIGKKEIDACRLHLLEEIESTQPKVILTLGEVAMNVVTGLKGITKNRGTVVKGTQISQEIEVIPTFSPSYIDRMPEHLNTWASDLLKAYNLSKGIVTQKGTTIAVPITTIEKVKELIGYCQETGIAFFDFETTEITDKGVFDENFYATMLSVSFQIGSAYTIPLFHKDSCFTHDECNEILSLVKQGIFENDTIRKIAHNLYYDASVLYIYGISLLGRVDDTMLMHHLLDETKMHGLKTLVAEYFPEYSGYDSEISNYKWDSVPINLLSQYAAIDTDLGLRLMIQLENELQRDIPSYIIYRNLTMAAFKPLWGASMTGMDIDRKFLSEAIIEVKKLIRRQSARMKAHPTVLRYTECLTDYLTSKAIKETEEKLAKWILTHTKVTATEEKMREKLRGLKAGTEVVYKGFSFGSPKQLVDLLYNSDYGFTFLAVKKSTGKDILDTLNDKSGFVDSLNTWRSLKKTLSTYLEGLDNRLDSNDRIHTTFKLQGTRSGRLSSANPNLQNIPNIYKLKEEDLIKATGYVKQSFISPEGYTLVQLDYSQAELRIIASFAKDEAMMEVYKDNGDIHSLTAAKMLGVSLEEFKTLDKGVQKEARSKAKAVNFGLIYGMGAKGFMEYARIQYGLIVTLDESTKIRNLFFTTYPRLLDYHDEYIAKGRKFGWVRTLFGRRRRLPDINGNDDFKASNDDRVAINSPIQGTAGEFTIFSIALLHNRIDPRILFVNTVHDSILFYIPDEILEESIPKLKYTCENLPTEQYFGKTLFGGIGMGVDVEVSKTNWQDMKEFC